MQREAGRIAQMLRPLPRSHTSHGDAGERHAPAGRAEERMQTRASPVTGSTGHRGAAGCGQRLPGLRACFRLGGAPTPPRT